MRAARGFTLVEVLVALALLGAVAVLAYRGVAALVDGEVRLAGEARHWRTLDAAFARLEADLRQAVPRAVRAGAATEPAWLSAVEPHGASALAFSRAGTEFGDEPGRAGQRIGYRVRDGVLEVVYWPTLDRAQGGPAGAQAYPLAEGIAQFRVEHLDARGTWHVAWPQPGEAALPRALRVRFVLANGTAVERWFALR